MATRANSPFTRAPGYTKMIRMNRLVPFAFAALTAAAWPASGTAQNPSVVGVVRDSAGVPIALAEVTVMGKKVLTDSLGRFFVSHLLTDSVRVAVRRLGYDSVSFMLSSDDASKNSVDVVLRRLASTLETVDVEEMELRSKTALKGFDERKQRGLGVFVSRSDIEKRNTRLLSDVLRTQRGVIMSSGRYGLRTIRFTNYQSKNCVPLVWLDGQRAPELDIDAVSARDVEGVELYQSMSTTPAEFHRGNTGVECGTIVIWTKRPMLEAKPSR